MNRSPRDGRRGGLVLLALVAAIGGIVVLVVAVLSQRSAPQPSAGDRGTISVPPVTMPVSPTSSAPSTSARSTSTPSTSPPTTTGGTPPSTTTTELSLPPSKPVSVSIPAIDVQSTVIPIGKNADGTLAVPQPGPDLDKVAWYDGSATPGAPGPSVFEGHIDTVEGPSIFYRLGDMRIGDRITVAREDGSSAVFTVNAVRSYPTHEDFPIEQIFAAQLSVPSLRLITCSNFDSSSGHYVGNTVVYAHLTSYHHA